MVTAGADPRFFSGGGASIRNDFNLVSCLFCFFFYFCRILLFLERSSQWGEGCSPPPPFPSPASALFWDTNTCCYAVKTNEKPGIERLSYRERTIVKIVKMSPTADKVHPT